MHSHTRTFAPHCGVVFAQLGTRPPLSRLHNSSNGRIVQLSAAQRRANTAGTEITADYEMDAPLKEPLPGNSGVRVSRE
jgi:hypothetical protein